MYLSPWTWGSNDLQADYEGDDQLSVKSKRGSNFKAHRRFLAKERNDVPHFVTVVEEITTAHPPTPYLTNPLSKSTLSSKLGEYVKQYFDWGAFPDDVDIGERDIYCYVMFIGEFAASCMALQSVSKYMNPTLLSP
mmetsp:Transcript_78/g.144  ORF Transcript_78/g.144 Transcript_78/m.144 type:complete len:136 (+) Transcript_78:93-500(+)